MGASVSIITPSFNQGHFIERTIESVLGQGWPDLEYLVFDGGSTDSTVEILRRYDSRLRWRSEKDEGQADAVNKGLRESRGEIIGWLNSDDIYYPGAVAAVCDFFTSFPEADVVYGDANHIGVDDGVIEAYPTEPWCFERLRETCYLCQPAVFFRRRVVERFGVLDARLRYCMDYEYWIRLAMEGAEFAWLRQTLAGSRLHAETKTLAERTAVHREMNDMLRERLGRVPDKWLCNYAHAALDGSGYSRQGALFPLLVSGLSLIGACRWNRRVSSAMMRTMGQWSAEGFHRMFRSLSRDENRI